MKHSLARTYLCAARDSIRMAKTVPAWRAHYLTQAEQHLRRAIGAANREGRRKVSGMALLALAQIRTA